MMKYTLPLVRAQQGFLELLMEPWSYRRFGVPWVKLIFYWDESCRIAELWPAPDINPPQFP